MLTSLLQRWTSGSKKRQDAGLGRPTGRKRVSSTQSARPSTDPISGWGSAATELGSWDVTRLFCWGSNDVGPFVLLRLSRYGTVRWRTSQLQWLWCVLIFISVSWSTVCMSRGAAGRDRSWGVAGGVLTGPCRSSAGASWLILTHTDTSYTRHSSCHQKECQISHNLTPATLSLSLSLALSLSLSLSLSL